MDSWERNEREGAIAAKSDGFDVVYTPESQLRHPRQLVREMWLGLLASRELAWQLLVRDIKAQYRQSWLGIFWAFVPAIAAAVGLTLAKNANIINVGETDLPYPAYVLFGTTLWQTFAETLRMPIDAVSKAMPMLVKINIPKEAIVLAGLGQVFFNIGIKFILIAGMFVWFRIPVGLGTLVAPVALLHLVALGTFIGLLLVPVGVLYQDVSRLLMFAISGWLFLTPVIYPTPKDGLFGAIVGLNPVTPLLVTTRELAIGVELSYAREFWLVSGIAIAGLLVGWVVYRTSLPLLVERMSA